MRLAKEAEVIAKAEKLEDWDGPVYWEGLRHNDGYAADLSDRVDYLEDQIEHEDGEGNLPEFVFCCTTHSIELDLSRVIERATEEWPEGLTDQLDGEKELEAALAAFCEKNQKVSSWEMDSKRMVRLPKREVAP